MLEGRGIRITRSILEKLDIRPPDAAYDPELLEHIEILKSLSDGHITLDPKANATGPRRHHHDLLPLLPPFDITRSMTRVGAGSSKLMRSQPQAPALRRLTEGLRLELASAEDTVASAVANEEVHTGANNGDSGGVSSSAEGDSATPRSPTTSEHHAEAAWQISSVWRAAVTQDVGTFRPLSMQVLRAVAAQHALKQLKQTPSSGGTFSGGSAARASPVTLMAPAQMSALEMHANDHGEARCVLEGIDATNEVDDAGMGILSRVVADYMTTGGATCV